MAIQLPAECRTDTADLFQKSGVLTFTKLQHTPFLVFIERDEGVEIRIVDSAAKLMLLPVPSGTPVMVQWSGRWSSDFFKTTIGEIREAMQRLAVA